MGFGDFCDGAVDFIFIVSDRSVVLSVGDSQEVQEYLYHFIGFSLQWRSQNYRVLVEFKSVFQQHFREDITLL